MAPTRSLESDEMGDRRSSSDSRSKQKERKTVGENKAMIGARHGYDFVDLITMAIILKAGSMMKEDELFSCEISKEDATAGKFDDIVFRYTYKGARTILKIQVKHRTKNQEVALQELTETSFTEPFALIKYFKSFLEQYTPSNEKQIFVLCTNVQLENDAADWLEKVRPNDVCNIFDPIGATYYRFRKISEEEPRNTHCIANALKKASESYRLADILASHIHGQKELVLYTKNPQRNPLLSKYSKAIVHHMMEYSEEGGAFHINQSFLTNTDPTVAYFRKQFEKSYKEIGIRSLKKNITDLSAESFDVYSDIARKGIKTNDKLKIIELIRNSDQNDIREHLPTDIVTEEAINLFFDKFLIVCDTFSTDDLPSKIAEMWRSSKICKPSDLVCSLETEKYIEGLHRIVSKWMRSSPNLPPTLEAKHVEEIIKKVKLHLKYLLLKNASNKYIADHRTQSLRAKPECLRENPLYKFLAPSRPETNATNSDIFTCSTSYNSQFSLMIVLQTFQLLEGDLDQIFFVDINTIEKEKQIILDMCEFFEDPLVMVIDCEGYEPLQLNQLKQTLSQSILANRNPLLKIILLDQQNQHNSICFVLKEFEASSIETLIRANGWYTLFGTSVPIEVYKRETDDVSMILNFIDDQHKAPMKQCLVDDHYENIRHSYVQRHFESDTDQFGNIYKSSIGGFLDEAEGVMIPWNLFFEKMHPYVDVTYAIENMKYVLIGLEDEAQHDPSEDETDWQDKVHILLGEAGCGKSSYLSWLGWYLQDKDRASWVIRFNAIDYCTDFERLANEKEQLNSTEAMRFLYRMIHLTLFVRKINQQTISTTDEVRKEAEQCADLLELDADSKTIIVNEEKWGSSKMTSLQLVMVRLFQDKFNTVSLIILFDGFDEIIPHYKDVVFNLLARIQEFYGIKGMYLTSRPYNLHKEFETIFTGAKMHSLASFTQSDRLAALYLFMKDTFDDYKNTSLEQQIDLLGGLLLSIEILLKGLCEIPIYVRMAMEVLTPSIRECVNFKETTINTRIMKDLKKNFEKLQLIEQFVFKNLSVDKAQMIDSVGLTPAMKLQMDRVNKQTLRMHSILALYVVLDTNERERLHVNGTDALEYMEEIKSGREKTGIIEAVFDSKPLFIHRSFAEYFAAVWLFEHRDRDEVKRFLKSIAYWTENRKELREYFDRMLIIKSNCEPTIHMAMVDNSWEQIREKVKGSDAFLTEKDLGGRTVFHLMPITAENWIVELFTETLLCWPHLDEKDEILNWSALDYALIMHKRTVAINLLKFGAKMDLSVITNALLACDGEELLENLIYFEGLITEIASFNIFGIVEIFEVEVLQRVVDFMLKDKIMYLSHHLFDNLLVGCDAVITLKTLCDRDPELFPACRMKKLLIEAFKRDALHVMEYLVLECQYDVPLEVRDTGFLLEKCVAEGCNELFTVVFESYCVQHNIHLQPGATRHQGKLRLSSQFKVVPILPTFVDVGIFKTRFIKKLLLRALQYFNMYVIDYLLQLIRPEDCNYLLRIIIKQNAIYHDDFLKAVSGIRYFIGKSTGINYTNEEGTTLLHQFIQKGFYNLALMLIEEYGFEIGKMDTLNGWNAFHYCANNDPSKKDEMAIEEYNKLLNYMLAKKHAVLYLSAKDKQGRNVLQLAIENDNTCAVKIILQRNLAKCNDPNLAAALVANIVGKTTHQLNDDIKGMTLLHYVIGQKYYRLAQFLIKEYGFDIGKTDTNNGWNAFHYCAIDKESLILFEHILTRDHVDLHLSAKDKQGRNVLHLAVINGNVEIAREIIRRMLREFNWSALSVENYIPQSIHQVDSDAEGMTLLHCAIASRLYSLAIFLIQKYEFDIGETDTTNGWNAFHYCAQVHFANKKDIKWAYEELLRLMMSKEHANHLSVKDKQQRNVLHIALINENICMARAILNKKLEVTYKADQLAVLVEGYIRETTHLLEGVAEGMTLLHFAIESELYHLAIFLIEECGFEIGQTDLKNGWNAFHYCANIRCFEFLNGTIKNGINNLLKHMMMKENTVLCLSAEDAKGRTVIDIALKNGNFLIASHILLKKLIECIKPGPSVSTHANFIGETSKLLQANVEGMTLLHYAIKSRLNDLAIFLIEEYGFEIGQTDLKNGWNAFHYCANIPIVEFKNAVLNPSHGNLLDHMFANKHVDLNLSAKDKQGRNVLHIALINRSFLMACFILHWKMNERNEKDRSAAVHVDYIGETSHLLDGDGEGMTLLQYAILLEHFELAIFLVEEYGVNIGKTNPRNGWNAFHYCVIVIPFQESGAISVQYKKLLNRLMAWEHADLYLSAEDEQGRNVLQLAAKHNNFYAMKYILQTKFEKCNDQILAAALVANIVGKTTHQLNDETKGITLLHYVIGKTYYRLAEFLIKEFGYDIGQTDTNNGWNALHYCANIPYNECNEELVMFFRMQLRTKDAILHLSTIDLKERNVLHHAVMNENIVIARAILQWKLKECNKEDRPATLIDSYIRETTHLLEGDAEGMTLLHLAIKSKLCKLAIFLIEEYGYEIGKTDTNHGWNAFHYLANIHIEREKIDFAFIDCGNILYKNLFQCMMAKDHSDRYLFAADKRARNALHISIRGENFVMACLILRSELKESNKQEWSASIVRILKEAGVYGSKKCHDFLMYFKQFN